MWEIMVMAVVCAAVIFGIGFASINHAQKRGKGVTSVRRDVGHDTQRSSAVADRPQNPMTNSSGQQIGVSSQVYEELKTGKTSATLVNHPS